MFPDVQAQDRRIALHQRAVLVGAALHHQFAGGRHAQPGPAAAEAGQGRLGEGLAKGGQPAQLRFDGRSQRAIRRSAAFGRHDGPEQAVVGMAAAMIAHGASNGFGQLVQARDEGFDGFVRDDARAFQRGVQAGDVGLVMLAVVDLHRHRVDVRLQRVIGVRQGRKGVSHACLRRIRPPGGGQ
ncbi:hypothetical protein D3C72_1602750 [compost metagenome]